VWLLQQQHCFEYAHDGAAHSLEHAHTAHPEMYRRVTACPTFFVLRVEHFLRRVCVVWVVSVM